MTGQLPLTILGGFLGAGKTTLVNHLLRHANGLRIAVLVNEFGALPIDEDLIEAQDEDLISISGGCVCCSYGSDLTQALMDLAAMQPRPDHVVLEASGVAIPGAISAAVSLLQTYRNDGIVVMADAETLRQNADDRFMGDTVLRQLDDADLLVLNKCDLVDGTALNNLRSWIKDRGTEAALIEAQQAKLDPAVIMGRMPVRPKPSADPPGNPVESRVLALQSPVENAGAVAMQLADQTVNLIRAKGFVTEQDGSRHLIQVVGRRAETTAVDPKTAPQNGVVCLGLKGATDWQAVDRIGA